VTPQRAEVAYPAGAAITGATLTFRYQTKKGGINAYDSLATWNYTQTAADKNQGLLAADVVNSPATTLQMLSDPTASAHELPAAARQWTMFGGSLTSTTVPSHDCTTATTPCTGDDYATVTVTYNVAASAAGSTADRKIQLLFGGHLAPAAGVRGWGAGLGAGSVSGGPYHIKWDAADGASIGQRDNQITAGALVVPPALTITKTTSTSSVALGGTATFNIQVANSTNSTQTATGVQVTDTLPTGFTYASLTSATGGTRTATVNPTAGQTSLTFGTWSLAPGDTLSITFTATAPSAANSCGAYNNNAAFTSTNAGSGSTSSPATVTVTGCSASLSITKTTSTPSVSLGGAASFTITVTNSANATATATGVQLTDTLPAGFTFASGTSGGTGTRTATSNPTAGQTSLTWGTWSLAPGQTATATFTATAPATANSCATYTNNAGYTSTNAGSGSTSTPATVAVTGCTGNLSITKTTSTSSVALGGAATFTITVTNAANATLTATGVTITDTLPAGFTYASTGAAGGTGTRTATVNPTAGQTSLTFGTWSLAPGQTASVTFTATAPSAANSCGAYNNNASVSSGNDGSASTTSPATVTVTGCAAGLSITKTTSTATIGLGGVASFQIQVANASNATLTATGVQITDTLPTGFTYAATGTSTGGTRTATVNPTAGDTSLTFGTWSIAPGQTVTVNFTATAPSTVASCGAHNNNASFTSGNDGQGSTTSPATVTILCPDVSVLKTAGAAVSAGSTVTFTIVVTAGGTGDSTQVMLTDALATGHTWTVGGADGDACTITAGLLSCDFGTMTNGSTRTITLSTTATSADCPEGLANEALLSAAVDVNLDNNISSATQTVNCGAISLAKTADAASVASGSPIGFLITATNSGAGTATAVTVSDTLPTTSGTSWTIDAAASDTGCSITTGTLTCNFGDLGSKASKHVHLTSPTTLASCSTINNTATVRTGNDGTSTATASVTVNCPPPPALGGIQVTKYNDANRNGARDAGEAGLQGFVFTVKSFGVTVATITSDAGGTATAVNLNAGTYTVTETQQTGWTSTDPGSSLTKTVTVNAGQTTSVLFGNATVQLPPTSAGTLVVTKYNDQNANKTRDANEPVLSGWTFTVKDSAGATVGTATTDANGNATFQNLGFGTYSVIETLKAGWTSTDPGGTTPTKTVTISAPNTTVLFGNAQIKLPNTSTLETPPASPSPALIFLLAVLLGQVILIATVFRRWRND
jgi:uncharacterized repeat protein (TIGR01451 family)/fimbrial isopeptide formation D2 family protein